MSPLVFEQIPPAGILFRSVGWTSVGPLGNHTGRVVSDESEIAGLLNRYFASTFTQEQSGELPTAESIYQGGEEGLLQKIQVGVEEVKEQRGNLSR